MSRFLRILTVVFILFYTVKTVGKAQNQPALPVYIVQSGDTITLIAARFGIAVSDLLKVNQLENPDFLSVGDQLSIPGLEGINGVLTTKTAQLGETYQSIIRRYQIPEQIFNRLNRVTSPSEIYAGSPFIIPSGENGDPLKALGIQSFNSSSLELAVKLNCNPWFISKLNQQNGLWDSIPGEITFGLLGVAEQEINIFSPVINSFTISPLPLIQGETIVIKVQLNKSMKLTGSLLGHQLVFFDSGPMEFSALQGINRMIKPGLYPIQISGVEEEGSTILFEQPLLLMYRPNIQDPRLPVDPITTDPIITESENELIKNKVETITPNKYWTGLFVNPVDVPLGYSLFPDCTTDQYGNLRAYNDGPFTFFHTGLDLSACGNNLNIYASASGYVVLAESLVVRGNYILIDHGWGIFSGYGHLSKLLVKAGDRIEVGQLIGLIGKTGRVTGPHLHWEIWVNKELVDPVDWLNSSYP